MSQFSQNSQSSTIIYCDSQDPSFRDEILSVDKLYFNEINVETNSSQLSSLSPAPSYLDFDADDIQLHNDESDNESVIINDVELEVAQENIQPEPSHHDVEHFRSVDAFNNDTCGCKKLYGKPCSTVIDFEDVLKLKDYCLSLDREEHDLVIQSALYTHRVNGPTTSIKSRHVEKERERPTQRYFIKGIEVCKQLFCFCYNVGKEKLQKIGQSLDEYGLQPRTHGNKNKMPHNALTYADREQIQTFLSRYANENAMPLPGRLPNHRQSKVLLLPSDKRQVDVHQAYNELANSMNIRPVSLTTFVRTWHDLCPHIVLGKPSTDLCHRCQDFSTRLSNSGNLIEEEKVILIDNYKSHVSQAQIQREQYKRQCEASKVLCRISSFDEGAEPCSEADTTIHYSWDFAQQVFIPHHSQQVGPIYFKTPRKCEIFGVSCEGLEKQVFYVADEGVAPGKGANTVISYVHHYLQTYGLGETTAQFHFDNCCGQNKNNAVLWYALWRVMAGLHMCIHYSLMIAGHTKFSPDWHFGLWKSRWRRVNAETVEEVAESIHQSSRNGHNVPHIVNGPEDPVTFYDWKSFLGLLFKPLKNISKYHSFVISSSQPGVVVCREFANDQEKTFSLLRKDVVVEPGVLPQEIHAPGLDADRQWYLYENIRPFFRTENSKDITCPLPKIGKCGSVKKQKLST